VKMKYCSSLRLVIVLLMIGVLSGFTLAYAQIDEMEELEESAPQVKCEPDSLNTIYDLLADSTISQQQVNIWYSFAKEELKYEHFKAAIPYYWKVLVNDKSGKFKKFVYGKLATCYYRINEPDSVLLVAARGLKEYPDNKTLHWLAASIFDRLNRYQCAIPHYEALVKADPNNKQYWSRLAFFYYQDEDSKAIQAQQKVVEIDPNDVEAARLLAEIMEHFGEDPLKARKETFLKDTTNIENALRYAKAAYERGLYEDAIRPFAVVNKLEPKNTTALEYLGRCYEGLDKLSRSLRYYKQILEIEPKNVKVICLIASVYGRLDKFSVARSYVNRAKRIDRSSGLPHIIMAEIYENAIQYCSEKRKENKLTYDDKLVYLFAQKELRKAVNDPDYGNDAKRRIKQLEPLVPTKADFFMQKNRKKTKEACYDWINK